MKKVCFFVISLLCLVACSQYSSNGEHIYLRSKNGNVVIVPPPLTDNNLSHFYDLPPQNQNAQVNIAPPSEIGIGS